MSFTNPRALSAVTGIPDPLLSPFLIARKLENQLTLLAAAGGSGPVCAILLQRTGKFYIPTIGLEPKSLCPDFQNTNMQHLRACKTSAT